MDISEEITSIDDSLYSRQRYVLGDEAMHQMALSSVYLNGLGGTGIEIAKNLVLAGIKHLIIQDNTPCLPRDQCDQFFISDYDIELKKTRAEASLDSLRQLNPYVTVSLTCDKLSLDNLTALKRFQCVVLTMAPLDLLLAVDEFCRQNCIKFIAADCYGVFCSLFCDFGNEFFVKDSTGEEANDIFVADISQSNPAVVQVADNRLHDLEVGDLVTFRELSGMMELEKQSPHTVTQILSPTSFTIGDCSVLSAYVSGGIARRLPRQRRLTFQSLASQLDKEPSLATPDLSRCEAPSQLLHLWRALLTFRARHADCLPQLFCDNDAAEVVDFMNIELSPQERLLMQRMASVSSGCLVPLCAFVGGLAAQEVLKALTGKFSPLQQWLLLDCRDVLPTQLSVAPSEQASMVDNTCLPRLQPLEHCIGKAGVQALRQLRTFMVGCGAIGCEMLKNLALLGVATDSEGETRGLITITDHDLIEKSNLNRQFLFRPEHIRCPKSTTAASAVLSINAHVRVHALQHRVGQETERIPFDNRFFSEQDVCINALDNLETRRYMDSRCVANARVLLESGTMGTKGHSQIIVPHLTENYAAQNDPSETIDIPYCTLKSFPSSIEHCIEWSREKFESSFAHKPAAAAQFWMSNDPFSIAEALEKGSPPTGSTLASSFVIQRPLTWFDCLTLARAKFEKYFNHRARNLLTAFPLTTKLPDGSNFWTLPKRPPQPVHFDVSVEDHRIFVWSCARLYAIISGVPIPPEFSRETPPVHVITPLLADIRVPEFRPSGKRIVVDESVTRTEAELEAVSSLGGGADSNSSAEAAKEIARIGGGDICAQFGAAVRAAASRSNADQLFGPTWPVNFEKDDDTNGHMDFIASAANLRAAMYSIAPEQRLRIKRLAGRIVPAIATTTAAIAGLLSLELVKLAVHYFSKSNDASLPPAQHTPPIELFRNAFLNLALPLIVLSEPAPVVRERLNSTVTFTIWDRWEIGPPPMGLDNFTVRHFLEAVHRQYGLVASMVVQGLRMVYLTVLPIYRKRLDQPIMKFLKVNEGETYVDLILTFENDKKENDSEDLSGPSLRFHFM